eukprot:scaffold8366_cov19-Prasinocladus_malaysianus.AAC.1
MYFAGSSSSEDLLNDADRDGLAAVPQRDSPQGPEVTVRLNAQASGELHLHHRRLALQQATGLALHTTDIIRDEFLNCCCLLWSKHNNIIMGQQLCTARYSFDQRSQLGSQRVCCVDA